jgi:hypothetical protein
VAPQACAGFRGVQDRQRNAVRAKRYRARRSGLTGWPRSPVASDRASSISTVPPTGKRAEQPFFGRITHAPGSIRTHGSPRPSCAARPSPAVLQRAGRQRSRRAAVVGRRREHPAGFQENARVSPTVAALCVDSNSPSSPYWSVRTSSAQRSSSRPGEDQVCRGVRLRPASRCCLWVSIERLERVPSGCQRLVVVSRSRIVRVNLLLKKKEAGAVALLVLRLPWSSYLVGFWLRSVWRHRHTRWTTGEDEQVVVPRADHAAAELRGFGRSNSSNSIPSASNVSTAATATTFVGRPRNRGCR